MGDTRLPFLGIEGSTATRRDVEALRDALVDADLVVVENLCSLPLNLSAAAVTAEVLAGFSGRVVFHHHDLPWERAEFAHIEGFPPRRPGSLHVANSDQAKRALSMRGLDATMIRNTFDSDPAAGDRFETRAGLGVLDDEFVVLQPTRAIARKEVGRGLRFAEEVAASLPGHPVRYWLTGAAEDGYGPTLRELVSTARIPVTHQGVRDVADAYAAADLVVIPSSWEGFGNPVIEAIAAGRPVAAAGYPVLDELRSLGLAVLPLDDPIRVASFLKSPDVGWLRQNREVVRRELSIGRLPERLSDVFAQVGWDDW